MALAYKIEKNVAAVEVATVFRAARLRRPTDNLERISRMVHHANLVVCARDDGRLIGVARSLTDFAYCCYLSDLAVDPAYQHKGVGKELVRLTREAIGPESMLLLLAAPSAEGYYPHLGFKKVENAWMLDREM